MDNLALGDFLKEICALRGISYNELSKLAGVSRTFVSKTVNGDLAFSHYTIKLLMALGVNLDYFYRKFPEFLEVGLLSELVDNPNNYTIGEWICAMFQFTGLTVKDVTESARVSHASFLRARKAVEHTYTSMAIFEYLRTTLSEYNIPPYVSISFKNSGLVGLENSSFGFRLNQSLKCLRSLLCDLQGEDLHKVECVIEMLNEKLDKPFDTAVR